MSIDLRDPGRTTPMIPGAYERKTPTSRQPGAMGGSPFGSVTEPTAHSSMSAATIADREREGGGAPSQRRGTENKRSWLTGQAIALTKSPESHPR